MKIRICEKCNKQFNRGYKTCPYCGNIKFVEYEVKEKIIQKHCAFCDKLYDESYKSCPYCGSTKIIKEEIPEEKEVLEEPKKEDEDNYQSSKICEECGRKHSLNLEKCPYCGSTKSTIIELPKEKICDTSLEWKKNHIKRREKNEYLKGLYVGGNTDLISKEIMKDDKKIDKNFKKGLDDAHWVGLVIGSIIFAIGLIYTVMVLLIFNK